MRIKHIAGIALTANHSGTAPQDNEQAKADKILDAEQSGQRSEPEPMAEISEQGAAQGQEPGGSLSAPEMLNEVDPQEGHIRDQICAQNAENDTVHEAVEEESSVGKQRGARLQSVFEDNLEHFRYKRFQTCSTLESGPAGPSTKRRFHIDPSSALFESSPPADPNGNIASADGQGSTSEANGPHFVEGILQQYPLPDEVGPSRRARKTKQSSPSHTPKIKERHRPVGVWVALILNHVQVHGGMPMRTAKDHEVKRLAWWCNEQKRCYRQGKLRPEDVKALEGIPGWDWGQNQEKYRLRFDERFVNQVRILMELGRMPYRTSCEPFEKTLYSWCKDRRREYRTGKLSKERVEILNAIPGWFWTSNGEFGRRDAKNDVEHLLEGAASSQPEEPVAFAQVADEHATSFK